MTKHRRWLAGGTCLFLALGIYLAGQGQAGEKKGVSKDILKIAETLKKGDVKGAAKHSEMVGKNLEELFVAMELMIPRRRGGLGVGDKSQNIVPDGIELKLLSMGRDAPTRATMDKEADAIEDMAYTMAAIAEVTKNKAPARDRGKMTKKAWIEWSNDMYEASIALAKAAKAKGGAEVKTAAAKVTASCNSCHSVFR